MKNLNLKKISGLLAIIATLVSGCAESTSTSAILGAVRKSNIIALPIADYCAGFNHDGDRERQTVINNVIFARLHSAGLGNYPQDELFRRLQQDGILQKNTGKKDIAFFESDQWGAATGTMVAGINPLDSPTALPKPASPLNPEKIFVLGRILNADYVIRGRIVEIGREDIALLQNKNKILPFYLLIKNQPAVLFAQAKMYDIAVPHQEKSATANRVELQLYLQETTSGNIVWQGKAEIPGSVTSGFSVHKPFQKSLKKMARLAGELLNDLIRQSNYSGSADNQLQVEDTGSTEALPEPYPVFPEHNK